MLDLPIDREGLEAVVREAIAPQQLEALLNQFPPRQLTPPELVLFLNQLAKTINTSSSTVRAWSQTQARAMPCAMHADPLVLAYQSNRSHPDLYSDCVMLPHSGLAGHPFTSKCMYGAEGTAPPMHAGHDG